MAGSNSFHRTELLIGKDAVARLAATRVILFGVGGVGSWCAEALVRSGVGHLTLVDSDLVCVTNVNRQLQATPQTVGKVKVFELRRRLLELNPAADVLAVQKVYDITTRDDFDLGSHDYVIDAIDSLSNKLGLLWSAVRSGATVYSAMGASARLDPTRVRVGSVWKTEGCPLARKVRKRLRRQGFQGDFLCVYSDEEVIEPNGGEVACGTEKCFCPRAAREDSELDEAHEWCSSKAVINGSVVHMTATFGMFLAGLVVQDVTRRAKAE